MGRQQSFSYNITAASATTEIETGGKASSAVLWIVGVILVLCILLRLIHAVRSRLRRGQQQQGANEETAGHGLSTPRKQQSNKVDPSVLDKFRITLKENHFHKGEQDFSTTTSESRSSLSSLSVEKGTEDDVHNKESKSRVASSDAVSVGTKDTDDENLILDPLEDGASFKHIFLHLEGSEDKPKVVRDACAICLSSYKVDETIVYLPMCEHAYHYSCMSQVIQRDPKCPLCRRDLLPTMGSPTTKEDSGENSRSIETNR